MSPRSPRGNSSTSKLPAVRPPKRSTSRFERITPGGPTQCFEVAANLTLFHTLRIAIQEGPVLCMRVIAAELEAGRKWEDPACCPLPEQHMRDYLASRPAPGAKAPKAPRRPSVYPAPAPWT